MGPKVPSDARIGRREPLTVSLLVLLALRVHLWQRSGLLCDLLKGSNFPYWSLMHIAMAYWHPRRG